jgi:hypothetical protein
LITNKVVTNFEQSFLLNKVVINSVEM